LIKRYSKEYKDEAIALGRAMHAESRFHSLEFSDQKILRLLEMPNVFGAFSISQDAITGFFLGVVQQMWFSDAKFGFDLALYIKPEYRKHRTLDAVRLIHAFERFCAEQGCIEVNLGSTAEISTETAKHLYARLGYSECGFVTKKVI